MKNPNWKREYRAWLNELKTIRSSRKKRNTVVVAKKVAQPPKSPRVRTFPSRVRTFDDFGEQEYSKNYLTHKELMELI